MTFDKLALHTALIILLFCGPKSPAYKSRGTELDIFDTKAILQVGRFEQKFFYDRILHPVYITLCR